MDRFFGGRPVVVILRLVIISVVVGIVLAALDLDALRIFQSLGRLVARIRDLGLDAVRWAGEYFLLGAVIVFPVWAIARALKLMGRKSKDTEA